MKRRGILRGIKRRDPASFLKVMGALRTKPYADKRKKTGRKAKHRKKTYGL